MKRCEVITISTEMIHLDQLLKWMGLTETGGQARFLIDSGIVKVNGVIVRERRKQVHPGDILLIEGQEYSIQQEIE